MKTTAPILSKLLHDKDPRSGRSFDLALEHLNVGAANGQIWNVEVNDAKFTLSNAVDRALDVIYHKYLGGRGRDNYEEWTNDLSMYCSFNQAKGRIARLQKNAPKTAIVAEFIAAYQEVEAIWNLICSLKPITIKGRRPNENKTEAQVALELKNTGMCAICDHRQKLDADKMVHHGYKMSDYNHSGYRIGKCFGTDHLCYELSNEANIAFKPVLTAQLRGYTSALKTLKSGTVETLTVTRQKYVGSRLEDVRVTLMKGTPEFDTELGYEIERTKRFIGYTKSDIKVNDLKISGWTLQPLKYGR